jgi:hypothetical protein
LGLRPSAAKRAQPSAAWYAASLGAGGDRGLEVARWLRRLAGGQQVLGGAEAELGLERGGAGRGLAGLELAVVLGAGLASSRTLRERSNAWWISSSFA